MFKTILRPTAIYLKNEHDQKSSRSSQDSPKHLDIVSFP